MLPCDVCGNRKGEVGHCFKCDGYGAEEKVCPVCKGEGVHGWTIQEVLVRFSPKVEVGHVINILGEGEHSPKKPPGSVRVIVV